MRPQDADRRTVEPHDHQCPFINRPDDRCAQHFQLDDLHHAFEYCCNKFTACAVYVERLVEYRVRKQQTLQPAEGQSSYGQSHAPSSRDLSRALPKFGARAAGPRRQPLVQVTVHAAAVGARLARRPAAPEDVSDAFGFGARAG